MNPVLRFALVAILFASAPGGCSRPNSTQVEPPEGARILTDEEREKMIKDNAEAMRKSMQPGN